MENNQSPYLIPGAIAFAGILIAGAVLFNGNIGNDQGVANDEENKISESEFLQELGIDQKDFEACNTSGRHMARIDANTKDATTSGGTGTPHSVVVLPNGQRIPFDGAQPYENVKNVITAVLALQEGELIDTEGIDTADAEKVIPVSGNDHILGSPDAKMVLIEFSDLECPFCASFHTTMERIMEEHGNNKEIAWVYRHFPLDSIHPDARPLAHKSECVAELAGEEAFWKYISYVFQS